MLSRTLRRARNRILLNDAIRWGVYAASTLLAAAIALLLAGTQIFSWIWLFLLPGLTLAAGVYMVRRSAPSLYATAQTVDRRLGLADTLSTAFFFDNATGAAPDIREAQRAQAERVAAGVDARRAVPLSVPRAVYATALLALAAGSLLALRYGFDRRLDLRPPFARVLASRLGYSEAAQNARNPRKPAVRNPRTPGSTGVAFADAPQQGPGELDAAKDSALDTPGVPQVDNKDAAGRADNSKTASSAELQGGQNPSDQPEGLSTNSDNRQQGDGKQGSGAGKPGQGDDRQGSANSGENSGLLGKFRDAMSSLLNRVRQQGGGKAGPQQSAPQNGQQKNQQGGEGQNARNSQAQGEGQQANAAEGEPGEDSQNAQGSQPGNPGENGQQPATKQPGSGIGRQDGSKDVKLAEQLAAMGKISEIIGKRAANVTGDMTVEVQNGSQQLRTPYAQSGARHAEAGGEIHRDEIPVALQAYVQQYFEQVRKQPAPVARARHRPEPAKPGI